MEQRYRQWVQTTLATALIAGGLLAGTAIAQGTPGGSNPSTQSPSAMGSTPGVDTNRGTTGNGMGSAMTPDRTPQVSVPGKAELAPSAFGKLDASRRGYVTREDTTQLNGFDTAFQQADANKDGRLTQDEFNRAWSLYSNQK